MAVFIVLLGAFSYALSEIIYGYLCNNQFKNPITLTFFASIINFLFLPCIFFWGTPTLPPLTVIPAYVSLGIIMVLVQIPAYQAFKENDTSVVNCLWTLGKVILPFAAFIFLGEKLIWQQYLGFFLIIFSNIFLNFDTSAKSKLNLAFFLMLGCSLFNTASSVIEKYILNEDTNWINLIVYVNIFSTLITSLLLINKKIRTDIIKHTSAFSLCWKHFIGAEILSFIGHCCGIYALSRLPLVVKSALSSTESAFILVLSLFMIKVFKINLKEKVTKKDILRKIICFSFVILGIILSVKI